MTILAHSLHGKGSRSHGCWPVSALSITLGQSATPKASFATLILSSAPEDMVTRIRGHRCLSAWCNSARMPARRDGIGARDTITLIPAWWDSATRI